MNKKKPTVIILYGPMAVGKLTVAQKLSKKLKMKLSHNHTLNDFVDTIFERDELERYKYIEKLRYQFYEEAVKSGHSFILTHCFSYNFVNPATGVSDPKYLKNLETKLTKAGARVCFVHLKADDSELMRRVSMESRKLHRKLIQKSIMKKCLKEEDWQTSAPVKNNVVINNTNLSPQKVVAMIIKEFNL